MFIVVAVSRAKIRFAHVYGKVRNLPFHLKAAYLRHAKTPLSFVYFELYISDFLCILFLSVLYFFSQFFESQLKAEQTPVTTSRWEGLDGFLFMCTTFSVGS